MSFARYMISYQQLFLKTPQNRFQRSRSYQKSDHCPPHHPTMQNSDDVGVFSAPCLTPYSRKVLVLSSFEWHGLPSEFPKITTSLRNNHGFGHSGLSEAEFWTLRRTGSNSKTSEIESEVMLSSGSVLRRERQRNMEDLERVESEDGGALRVVDAEDEDWKPEMGERGSK
ncbi:hypothetical protein EX30DRAFT_382711 [Ascodesmis nigricans]|uniref:Uncharacterized protein n=1 Tax=Ascodesmis nigricans TaxID=341454 RepID=A0A4S2MSP0_9PEZI|nr:hypothetical protein EX30DRAFT_382711 [Ascodesmis nigricans]